MLESSTAPRLLLDCDTGRDDALALFMARPLNALPVAVLSTYGNVALDQVIENNRHVLGLIAPKGQTRLFRGCAHPRYPHRGWHDITLPRQAQAGNGLCNVVLPEVVTQSDRELGSIDDLARWLIDNHVSQGGIDYIVTGPMTSVARLVDILGSDTERCIRSVTIMGGKFDPLWSMMPGADFNIACDPFAFERILSTPLPLRIVPMNVTWPIALPIDKVLELEVHSESGFWAKEIMLAYCRTFSPDGMFRFHDPVAYLAAICPLPEESVPLRVVCDESSADFARLVKDHAGRTVKMVSHEAMDSQALLSLLLDALNLSTPQSNTNV